MKFSQEFIERVALANNLVEIISQHTQLKPGGGGLMGRCPFPDHAEKTPSFSLSEVKQVYHCFGCHKSGNVYTFLEQFNGMSFPEAVEYLANRANISMPVVDREQSEKLDRISIKKRQILNANRLAMQFFCDQFRLLGREHKARVYAEKRGLNPELIEIFKIGYAPPEWDSLIRFLTNKGVSLEVMEEAKLIKARSTGTGHFDLFRDRLMFTIFDTKNEVIAFGGRILEPGDVKYMNSPETLVFSKSRTLYGLSETAKFIRSEDQAIVVEGYMDLIALYRAGIKNVVAPMGTALTAEQSRMLARLTQNVVVLFDGDEAGKNAAEKSLPILLEVDVHPKGLTLPDELDPDEYLVDHKAEDLQKLIQKSPDLFSDIVQRWMEGYRGEASQKVQLADRLKPLFRAIQDPRLRDLYLQDTAVRMAVDAKWLGTAVLSHSSLQLEPAISQKMPIKGGSSGQRRPEAASDAGQSASDMGSFVDIIVLKKATKAELLLMAAAIKNRANFETVMRADVIEKILDPGVKAVLKRAASVYGQEPDKFATLSSLLTSFVDDPDKLQLSLLTGDATSLYWSNNTNLEDNGEREKQEDQKLLQDCVTRVRERFLRYQAHQIAQEIKTKSLNPNQIDVGQLEQFMKLQRDRLALRNFKEPEDKNKIESTSYEAKEDDSEFE